MNGYWVVLETGQGGGLPDTVHGPYFHQLEANEAAIELRAEAARVERRDRFEIGVVDVLDEEEDE